MNCATVNVGGQVFLQHIKKENTFLNDILKQDTKGENSEFLNNCIYERLKMNKESFTQAGLSVARKLECGLRVLPKPLAVLGFQFSD